MILNIDELREREDPLLIEGDFGEPELGVGSQVSGLGRPVHAALSVELTGEQVHVIGELGTSLALTCCRCLKRFEEGVCKKFELDYRPDPAPAVDGEEVVLKYNDLAIGFYRRGELDISALVSEQVVLEIPMKPICREDCKGLCDQCGADLNDEICDCQADELDPRLAALLDFKKRMEHSD